MTFDFNTIKNNSQDNLIRLARLIDPQLNNFEDSIYYVRYCYPPRDFKACDIIYYINAVYPGGLYDSPTLRIVVRYVITVPPRVVCVNIKNFRNSNIYKELSLLHYKN